MGHHEHENQEKASHSIAVVTFTDTRDKNTDKSGALIIQLLEEAGHDLADYKIVKEDQGLMKNCFEQLLERSDVDAVVTNGGTGLSKRDNTIEVVKPFFEKELEGFGEIFRQISYQQIGAAAMLSRATAGINGEKAVFCLPGSSKAVKLAMQRIILPQLSHLLWEARR